MSDSVKKARPEFRNIGLSDLRQYRLPLAGKVSILHRISGVVLFFMLPVLLLPLFELSLTSEETFVRFHDIVSMPLVKLVLLGLIWSYTHHFCAGIRFLLLDVHVGLDKYKAAKSAASVLTVSLLLTAIFGLKLFGVF